MSLPVTIAEVLVVAAKAVKDIVEAALAADAKIITPEEALERIRGVRGARASLRAASDERLEARDIPERLEDTKPG